jgi:starvation-inducible outer membrane lipoprotein
MVIDDMPLQMLLHAKPHLTTHSTGAAVACFSSFFCPSILNDFTPPG